MIQDAISRLKSHIDEVPSKFRLFTEEEIHSEPARGKWSKKEVLGHLIDSACNNHSRFVRAQFENEPIKLIKYAQDDWVGSQKYREEAAEDIIKLWEAYNRHILNIISKFPQDKLNVKWDIDGEIHSTEWLISDYVDHIEHHLKQIFN